MNPGETHESPFSHAGGNEVVVLPDDFDVAGLRTSPRSLVSRDAGFDWPEGAPSARGRARRWYQVSVFTVLAVVAGAGFLFWLFLGWSYYRLPVAERLLHRHHEWLRSSGYVGLTAGIAGTALMLFSLVYFIRKRIAGLMWLGSLYRWLGVHVLAGMAGPMLILIHAGLAPSSVLGTLSFCAMLGVVLTGLVGRFIYALVPRSSSGAELEREEILRRLSTYRSELEWFGVSAAYFRDGESAASENPRDVGFLTTLKTLLVGDPVARQAYRQLRREIRTKPWLARLESRILPLAQRLSHERQWVTRYREFRTILRAWRFFHRWLAITLLVIASLHIAVAVLFGDLWILAGGGAP